MYRTILYSAALYLGYFCCLDTGCIIFEMLQTFISHSNLSPFAWAEEPEEDKLEEDSFTAFFRLAASASLGRHRLQNEKSGEANGSESTKVALCLE